MQIDKMSATVRFNQDESNAPILITVNGKDWDDDSLGGLQKGDVIEVVSPSGLLRGVISALGGTIHVEEATWDGDDDILFPYDELDNSAIEIRPMDGIITSWEHIPNSRQTMSLGVLLVAISSIISRSLYVGDPLTKTTVRKLALEQYETLMNTYPNKTIAPSNDDLEKWRKRIEWGYKCYTAYNGGRIVYFWKEYNKGNNAPVFFASYHNINGGHFYTDAFDSAEGLINKVLALQPDTKKWFMKEKVGN